MPTSGAVIVCAFPQSHKLKLVGKKVGREVRMREVYYILYLLTVSVQQITPKLSGWKQAFVIPHSFYGSVQQCVLGLFRQLLRSLSTLESEIIILLLTRYLLFLSDVSLLIYFLTLSSFPWYLLAYLKGSVANWGVFYSDVSNNFEVQP